MRRAFTVMVYQHWSPERPCTDNRAGSGIIYGPSSTGVYLYYSTLSGNAPHAYASRSRPFEVRRNQQYGSLCSLATETFSTQVSLHTNHHCDLCGPLSTLNRALAHLCYHRFQWNGRDVTAERTSHKIDQVFCANFVLQATNAQGLGTSR